MNIILYSIQRESSTKFLIFSLTNKIRSYLFKYFDSYLLIIKILILGANQLQRRMSVIKPLMANKLLQKLAERTNTPMTRPNKEKIEVDQQQLQPEAEPKIEPIIIPIKRSSSKDLKKLMKSWVNDLK